MSRVAVIGLGKLGACMVAVFADAGHTVVGVDTNIEPILAFMAGVAPVDEPQLQELIARNQERITVTNDIEKAVRQTDIAFIIVPTPSLPDGSFDASLVGQVATDIAAAVHESNKDDYTIVVSSTVMPGTCDVLHKIVDLPIVYSPEFIALGTVIRDLRSPDMVLIGTTDLHAAHSYVAVMRDVVTNNPDWVKLSPLNAELTKIAVNAYVTMKISFANQLATICEGTAGADARLIAGAIGCDRRIGSNYLQPGGPFGGPCFPRDNRAFQEVAARAYCDAPLARATDVINDSLIDRIFELIPGPVAIGVLGLTYKVGTSLTDESLGTHLLECFPNAEGHDPTSSVTSPQSFVDDHPYIVIATPWPAYEHLDYSHCELVIDVWGQLDDGDNIRHLGVA